MSAHRPQSADLAAPAATSHTPRQAWMATLARASLEQLEQLLAEQHPRLVYQLPKPAETGLCMVRGRMGGTGRPFNLGEMTLTRCLVQLDEGTLGVAYVRGRDRRQAELAAVADALLQTGRLSSEALAPIRATLDAARQARSAAVASTKVDFFTLVRGEN